MSSLSRALAQLRREKGVSQRLAAQELGISQAVLSHYEKGIRQPGFSFPLRTCVYFQVSAASLLGPSLVRIEPRTLPLDALRSASWQEEQGQDIASVAQLEAQVLTQGVELLFQLLAQAKNSRALRMAYQ